MNENLVLFSVERSGHGMQTYSLVSSASFCIISRIIRHASEVPSGVAWMVTGFSAAPEFSFLWMSTLEGKNQAQSHSVVWHRIPTRPKSVAPAHVQQGHRQGSGTSTSATSALLQEGGKRYRGCLMPNLNALQLHLEGKISYRHAAGQKTPSRLGHEASLVNEVFCHPSNDHRSEE